MGALLIMAPAEATTLQFWRFNASENRLVFTTDDGVQPRAQLLANPTRLVIDLPGTTLGRSPLNQAVGGAIREVRVGQFDAQTTRIVIELVSGYTLDPQQIMVRGATPTQWMVQLPTPQSTDPNASPLPTPPSSATPSPLPSVTPAIPGAATQLEGVRVTPDGFFVRTRGVEPEIDIQRSRDRRQVTFDLANTALSPQLVERDITVNGNGVERVRIEQAQTSPPVARITLELSDEASEWRASSSSLGGVVILPSSGNMANRPPGARPTPTAPTPQPRATIQAIELAPDGSQLLIRANQPVTYTTGWDRATLAYRITIPSAQLADNIQGPQLGQGSPILSIRLRQEDEDTVVILLQPAAGVRFGQINQPGRQLLALPIQRRGEPAIPPVARPPVPTPSGPLPTVRNGRIVVVIDPGHGGSDPGAIGIGGLREIDIVLPIGLQVASLLEQQGVQVVLTRRDNRDVELDPRVQIAERANADLFVSIHANAINLSRPDVNGLETYYYSAQGERLARVIHSNLVRETGMLDRGVRRARFYVIRNTSMPSVLVETGFVTGAQDARLLSDPNFRNQMAVAIARGILQYIQQNF
ncbi:MAG: N-acetylmuramoyl-L-alanine amidase [Oculatellaceae cyanobacterium bins.114]|nr:N-acetylmuramoyl-L-alanine amidase [Oculatellaceae cyanobacterium bins.114]